MNLYDFSAEQQDGTTQDFSDYKGKVVLVVNTATGCGFTPQYKELEELYESYRDQGFEILDFPCNQFRNQAPGTDEEIHEFCTLTYGTQFPQFKKVEVNGEHAHPLFVTAATERPFEGFGRGPKALAMGAVKRGVDKEFGDKAYIKWNFTKFLFDQEGHLIGRYEPTAGIEPIREILQTLIP